MKYFIKLITIITVTVAFLLLPTALADKSDDEVYIECDNLRNALLVMTEADMIKEDDLTDLGGIVDLSNKGITSLVGIEHLSRADNIILSNNNITDISPLLKIEYIKEISVNLNNITQIPAGFSSLEYLKHLDISNNPIKQLPSDINEYQALKWLFIDYCGIDNIGSLGGIGDTLEWLVMPGNPMDDYTFLRGLPQLELLNVNECQLSEVPSLSANQNLAYLYISDNNITSLPDYLSSRPIRRIDASFNYISDLPDGYIQLGKMEQLILTDNLFREFPQEVLTYQDLRVLMLGYNLLEDVSPGLSALEELQRLSFTSNDFTQLVTYSEFEIPYSYQLSFSYNRLNLDDEETREILKDNHINGGIQRSGQIAVTTDVANTERVSLTVSGDFATYTELRDVDYTPKEVVILDNSTKNVLYIIDELTIDGNDITLDVVDAFEDNGSIDWEIVLVMSIDTWPITNMKYISTATATIVPAATATPMATPVVATTPEITTPSGNTDVDFASKIALLVIAALLIVSIVIVMILLLRKRRKH